ncbi:MAG: hypothetical protein RI564_11630, partial [Gracilimonas sp.]|nr:hypothetical protein [Gracilimonas sp.]
MMKYILISFLCLTGVSTVHAQTLDKSWEFTNLYAADDTNGQTHLFYDLNTNREYICTDVWGSRLYNTSKGNFRHMNPTTNTDSTFMYAGGIGGIGCSYS